MRHLISFSALLLVGCGSLEAPPNERLYGERGSQAMVTTGSCAVGDDEDTCGGQSPDGCWCDEQCAGFGDCCVDIVEVCVDPPAPPPTEPEVSMSCMADDGGDFCGEKSPDGCWCDEQCEGFGDCCEDRTDTCEMEPPSPPPVSTECSGNATYGVTFTASWDPSNVPNPHFSPLVGAVHSDAVSFWTPGGSSSAGMEVMAETGGTSTLRNEVDQAVSAGQASSTLLGSPIPTSPGSTDLEFVVSPTHSRLTLVSMVAPSPDWFVGTAGVDLCEDGVWVDDLTLDLQVWDAGTDSGPDFTSSNQDTVPAQPITLSSVFGGSAGTFTLIRL